MNFEHWLKLGGVEQTEFISIQKGDAAKQIPEDSGLNFVDGQKEFDKSFSFLDTAAVLANCDLLISNDSCVVHLAGSMGIPTWVALKWIPEWRWGLSGDTTPWYQSVRLFRQQSNGDWDSVVNEIRKNLL